MSYLSLEESVKGKTAIVTGGTSGIGKACVELFCEVGINVVSIGRRLNLGKEQEAQINKKKLGICRFYECDVVNTERIMEIVELTVKEFGHLDILVNNAGYYPEPRQIDHVEIKELTDIINTNLIAYIAASKYAMPYLRTTQGSIVNIGSVHGTTSVQGSVGYDATKGAIDAITRTFAIDEAQNNVRINNVKPGYIRTELVDNIFDNTPEEQREALEERLNSIQWMGRGGTPLEVARAVLFLASPWASFITGAELMVSGGYEIGEGVKVLNPLLDWGPVIKK